jgi:hypothetical protein
MTRIIAAVFRFINRIVVWHRLPFPISVINLLLLRFDLRNWNLFDTETAKSVAPDVEGFDVRQFRTANGSYNDLAEPTMGQAGKRFGRNVAFTKVGSGSSEAMMDPNPRLVSNELLARKQFIPATTLNILAPAWLQFMVHDWFNHANDESEDNKIHVPLPPDDDWEGPHHKEGHISIRPTLADKPEPGDAGRPKTYSNTETHWWDGSQIYGSKESKTLDLRSDPLGKLLPDGKMYLNRNGKLAVNEIGIEKAGVNHSWWTGLSILQHLFVKEHNTIVERLKVDYPDADGEWLFQKAKLINAAVVAKIHTVEWTPALLNNPTMRYAMRGNWWGALGEVAERAYGRSGGREVLTGIPGSEGDHHSAPYAMTEEFSAVYRMHPLIPDKVEIRRASDNSVVETKSLQELAGKNAAALYNDHSIEDLTYSFGIGNPGALRLHNFPNMLRKFKKQGKNGHTIDLGTIDILRDRERGIPRYCEFRRQMRMAAPKTFNEMTGGDEAAAAEIKKVYGEVEKVDLLVGTLVEPLPDGFAFSDTAFRIFILMASRRLKSDRFFAEDFNETIYTPAGMQWIQDTLMGDVISRHMPDLANKVSRTKNAFFPWPKD